MADVTGIAWCDSTLNLWIGCTRVSPACDNCYAATWGHRFGIQWDAPPKKTADSAFAKILGYQRSAARFNALHGHPRRVFINSLSDFFDNQAEQSWRDAACRDFEASPDVIFMLVTKRPMNVHKMVPVHWLRDGPGNGWPPNVWLLTTAENQEQYDLRVAHLLSVPGVAVAGISMEPMLEDIHPGKSTSYSSRERAGFVERHAKKIVPWEKVGALKWVIIGGESGRNARPMPTKFHISHLMSHYRSVGVAVFMKQLSQGDYPDSYSNFDTFPPSLKFRNHPHHA